MQFSYRRFCDLLCHGPGWNKSSSTQRYDRSAYQPRLPFGFPFCEWKSFYHTPWRPSMATLTLENDFFKSDFTSFCWHPEASLEWVPLHLHYNDNRLHMFFHWACFLIVAGCNRFFQQHLSCGKGCERVIYRQEIVWYRSELCQHVMQSANKRAFISPSCYSISELEIKTKIILLC